MKCVYGKKSNMRNKQEELEMCVFLQGCDLTGVTETWWDGSCDCSAGYWLLRNRQGKQGGGVVLYVNDHLKCMELHLGMGEEPTESLWVRIKRRAGIGDIRVGVCYRLPNQEEQVDEILCRQVGAALHSQALVLI